MEADLQLTVSGVNNEEFARRMGETVLGVVKYLEEEFTLDLRRLHQITLTADYSRALSDFYGGRRPGAVAYHTQEEFAVGIAQTLMTQRDDGEFELTLILDAAMPAALVSDEASAEEKAPCFHMLHHELCHVHDDNQKIDHMPHILLQERLDGKRAHTYSAALLCWSEYLACRMSASTLDGLTKKSQENAVAEAVAEASSRSDRTISTYWREGDFDPLVEEISNAGGLVARMCSYAFGYADGIAPSVDELFPKGGSAITDSPLKENLQKLHRELRSMYQVYPEAWTSLEVYDSLAANIDGIFQALGIRLTDKPAGLWVDILKQK